MDYKTQTFKVKNSRKASESMEVTFVIMEGPQYTVVPADILHKLGVEAYRDVIIDMYTEDDSLGHDVVEISRKVGEAYFELNGIGATSPVIFGEKEDAVMIGGLTVNSIGLEISFSADTLVPIDLVFGGVVTRQDEL